METTRKSMKIKIAVLTILATVSLWAVAQTNDMNNHDSKSDGTTAGSHHYGGKNRDSMNTNSDSEYGGANTNRWHGSTNNWGNAEDNMSNTNRHHWQHKDDGQNQNPPQN